MQRRLRAALAPALLSCMTGYARAQPSPNTNETTTSSTPAAASDSVPAARQKLAETLVAERKPPPFVPPATEPEPTGGFGVNLGVGFGFDTKPPDMTLVTPDGGSMKQFDGSPLNHLAGMQMIDLAVSVFYRTPSFLVLPILGFDFGFPVKTGYPGSIGLGKGSGSLSWVKGGPTFYDGLDILGVVAVFTTGTFRGGIDLLPGFRFVRTTGTITQGLLTIDAEAHDYSFSFHAEVSACFGARGAVSVCLYGTPRVYEFGQWMNGASFGVRMETN